MISPLLSSSSSGLPPSGRFESDRKPSKNIKPSFSFLTFSPSPSAVQQEDRRAPRLPSPPPPVVIGRRINTSWQGAFQIYFFSGTVQHENTIRLRGPGDHPRTALFFLLGLRDAPLAGTDGGKLLRDSATPFYPFLCLPSPFRGRIVLRKVRLELTQRPALAPFSSLLLYSLSPGAVLEQPSAAYIAARLFQECLRYFLFFFFFLPLFLHACPTKRFLLLPPFFSHSFSSPLLLPTHEDRRTTSLGLFPFSFTFPF